MKVKRYKSSVPRVDAGDGWAAGRLGLRGRAWDEGGEEGLGGRISGEGDGGEVGLTQSLSSWLFTPKRPPAGPRRVGVINGTHPSPGTWESKERRGAAVGDSYGWPGEAGGGRRRQQ